MYSPKAGKQTAINKFCNLRERCRTAERSNQGTSLPIIKRSFSRDKQKRPKPSRRHVTPEGLGGGYALVSSHRP